MIKTIIFDLDGVVYKGAHGIPGVAAEIHRLKKKGAQALFLTNNATKSRLDYLRHLAVFGITVRSSEIMTSSFGCAHYVLEKYGRGKKIFVIGEQGLKDELEAEAHAHFVEQGAEIVVVGLDRQITYHKLSAALSNLLAGAKFIVANSDPTLPTERGLLPGTGSIAALLSYASGRKPDVVVGKPSTYLIEKLLEMHNVKPKNAAFVGDRLDIDIRMANKMGMKSVLVLTGIAKKEDLKNAPASDKPDFVVKSAADVGKALKI